MGKHIPMKQTTIILLFLILITSCRPYTYVTYDRKGQGDVKFRKSLIYDDPDEGNPLVNPRFRSESKPLKQKLGRIRRAKKRYQGI